MTRTQRFVSLRKSDWDRLEALIAIGNAGGGRRLSADEVWELGYIYRRAAADLSIARRDFPPDRLAIYLNQIVARAHAVVYRAEAGEWRKVVAFFWQGFPQLFRQTWAFTGAAFLMFVLAAAAGFFAVLLVPVSADFLVPEQVAASVREQRMWMEDNLPPSQLMASVIMTNNIRVSLFAFA